MGTVKVKKESKIDDTTVLTFEDVVSLKLVDIDHRLYLIAGAGGSTFYNLPKEYYIQASKEVSIEM